jgi:RNA polymerase sigma-70 factor (ECF subfamily)
VGEILQNVLGLKFVRTAAAAPSPLEDEVTGLYDEFRTPLLRYVFSFGASAADAEELVQEVFLALFRHLRDGKPRTNLRGWIFRVAHNLALRSRLERTRDAVALDRDEVDPAPDPEQLAAGSQRQERLLAVLRALPETDRCCLSLRAEGLRYREIAEILGISLGSVANSLERSLARLSRADGGS